MQRSIILACLLALVSVPLAAQATTQPTKKKRRLGYAKPIVIDAKKEVYGARLKGLPVASLEDIARDPKKWDGKKVQLRGKIQGVCQKKGCWMRVKDGKQETFVRFVDYSFFVPLDVAGRPVACEGTVKVEVVKEAERKHLAEDAGKSAEEIARIKGDKVQVRFLAEAVQIGELPPIKKKGRKGEAATTRKSS